MDNADKHMHVVAIIHLSGYIFLPAKTLAEELHNHLHGCNHGGVWGSAILPEFFWGNSTKIQYNQNKYSLVCKVLGSYAKEQLLELFAVSQENFYILLGWKIKLAPLLVMPPITPHLNSYKKCSWTGCFWKMQWAYNNVINLYWVCVQSK